MRLIFLCIILFSGCNEPCSDCGDPKEHIPDYFIKYIEIRKANETRDTTAILRKRLTKQLADSFMHEWYNANISLKDSCKFFSDYWADITLTNGAMKTFDISGKYIRGTNGNCFCFEKENYIEQLWNESN